MSCHAARKLLLKIRELIQALVSCLNPPEDDQVDGESPSLPNYHPSDSKPCTAVVTLERIVYEIQGILDVVRQCASGTLVLHKSEDEESQ